MTQCPPVVRGPRCLTPSEAVNNSNARATRAVWGLAVERGTVEATERSATDGN